jgi:mitosis inhibitor protein kinase SWE1
MTHLSSCTRSPTSLVPSEAQTVIAGPPTRHQNSTAFLMVASFSPTHDAGGTLHCPSPTNIAHCNHAMQQIRRSLSRSPSRAPLVHVKSHSPSISTTPHIASPLSPTRHASTTNIFLLTAPGSPSPLAVPFPPSARVNRPTMRRNGALQSNSPRTRTSPKSPAKRGLSESLDNGNSTPTSPSIGKRQDAPGRRVTPEHTMGQENESTHHTLEPTDNSTSRFPVSRLEKRRSGGFADFVSMSSPLKRSDGIMNLDQASLGSPAKRRSLHGANFAPDFNIFDHEPTSAQPHHESNSNSEDEDMSNGQTAPMAPPASPFFSGIPKRSSSLRKSTLQHRQTERQLFHRSGRLDHTADSFTPNSFGAKVRQRLSLDNHVPTARDSPFSSQGSLPNASIHTMSQPQFQLPPNPHPLSRTLTQSSSSSSIVDESPTHEPIHRPEGSRGTLDFSKSLPVGASRPLHPHLTQESSKVSSNGSFSTPESYKFVKPHPAAFMSTGLISKKNRNVEEIQNNHGGSKSLMPDTPCKKPMNIFSSAHKPLPDSSIAKKHTRHSFGTPSTPFNPHASGPAPIVYGNGASIFGSTYKPDVPRRASFASIEGDDRLSQSPRPTTRHDSQSSVDFGFPPTPTRPGLSSELGKSHSRLPTSPPPIAQPVFTEPHSATTANNSKLNFVATSPGSADGDSDSAMGDSPSGASPSANLRLKSSQTSASVPASFTRSRLLRNLNSPTPLSRKSLAVSSPLISPLAIRARAKPVRLSPASPLNDRFDTTSPRTPQENILPPDPSGLSISAHSGRLLSRVYTDGNSSASANVPATPTGPKEYFPQFGRRTLTGFNPVDVDPCLTSRFEKVEIVGVGEFSQVYRVTQPAQLSPFQSFYTHSSSRSPSQKSLPDQVWAVKKSKQAYTGAKDRKRRIHEVDVLKALGHADHIISYIDSWEEKNHLYIQTEFCEEGSLDSFLAHVGTKGRLDDFRIWKILLELSLVSMSSSIAVNRPADKLDRV